MHARRIGREGEHGPVQVVREDIPVAGDERAVRVGERGKGRRLVRERNGQVCRGSASARFQGNQLQFDSSQARCPRGGTYVPQKVECTGQENTTQCKGRELGGANLKWDARFKRK